MSFKPFAAAVAAQFALMSQHELFVTKASPDAVYALYLAAFPEGSNPIFRERTEHDCSCCRNFIRNIGNVVAVINGQLVSVWDVLGLVMPYNMVADALSMFVKSQPIDTIYRTNEPGYGAETSKELLTDLTGKGADGVRTWHHFYGHIAAKHRTNDVGSVRGEFTSAAGVFERGLKELTGDHLATVLQLIDDKQLYRGEEHRAAVLGFSKLSSEYRALLTEADRNQFVMVNALTPFSRFRNTVIGSLLVDLADGVPEDRAIKSFEQKVAPTNYKRPTALITEGMKKAALETIQNLGLENALQRRLACIGDITMNNVLWADNAAKPMMKDGIAGVLDTINTNIAKEVAAVDISIADFLTNVLPKAKSIDMLVKNRHMTNFMAITGGMDDGGNNAPTNQLFKWPNNFAWTYTGNISDSIKERVKAAGGATDAVLRVSLAWFNKDDLDLHAIEPQGYEISFMTRGSKSPTHKGMLDVDMNAGNITPDPVENITWDRPGDGVYQINVHQYNQREKSDGGFTLEVENNGQVHQYSSQQSPTNRSTIRALKLTIVNQIVTNIEVERTITGGSFSQEKWGITTETPVRVNTIMHSPNHWDGHAIGNKHYMFILDGCKTDEPLRGILNEYLNSELEIHRKVFEVLGDKTKCQPTEQQLAGLGFSSTKGDSVQVMVTGDKLRKTYNLIF
jgi:hypothetical protein